jgi:hypothetical protein
MAISISRIEQNRKSEENVRYSVMLPKTIIGQLKELKDAGITGDEIVAQLLKDNVPYLYKEAVKSGRIGAAKSSKTSGGGTKNAAPETVV